MNSLGDTGVASLVQSAWPRLEVLGLNLNDIALAGAAALGRFGAEQLPLLQELEVDNNFVDSAGVAALTEGTWPCLEFLSLADNEIRPEGVSALARSRHYFPVLRKLLWLETTLMNIWRTCCRPKGPAWKNWSAVSAAVKK